TLFPYTTLFRSLGINSYGEALQVIERIVQHVALVSDAREEGGDDGRLRGNVGNCGGERCDLLEAGAREEIRHFDVRMRPAGQQPVRLEEQHIVQNRSEEHTSE